MRINERGITMKQFTWQGEKKRPLSLKRPCSCGCDTREGHDGVGYLTGSDKDGDGFTVWIKEEEVFQAIALVMSGF